MRANSSNPFNDGSRTLIRILHGVRAIKSNNVADIGAQIYSFFEKKMCWTNDGGDDDEKLACASALHMDRSLRFYKLHENPSHEWSLCKSAVSRHCQLPFFFAPSPTLQLKSSIFVRACRQIGTRNSNSCLLLVFFPDLFAPRCWRQQRRCIIRWPDVGSEPNLQLILSVPFRFGGAFAVAAKLLSSNNYFD